MFENIKDYHDGAAAIPFERNKERQETGLCPEEKRNGVLEETKKRITKSIKVG